MNGYMLMKKNKSGGVKFYQEELEKLGASKEFVNSDKLNEIVKNLAIACTLEKEAFEALNVYHKRKFNEKEVSDFLDDVFDFCLANHDDLKSSDDEWKKIAARLQKRKMSSSDKKDNTLKYELEKIGLMVTAARDIAEAFNTREIAAFKNYHNYDFPEMEDKHTRFAFNMCVDYLFIEFPDKD